MHPEGIRVGIGFFFVVIPTINYSDILLDITPMLKGYDQQKLIEQPDSTNEGFVMPDVPGEVDLSDVQIKGYDYEDE